MLNVIYTSMYIYIDKHIRICIYIFARLVHLLNVIYTSMYMKGGCVDAGGKGTLVSMCVCVHLCV